MTRRLILIRHAKSGWDDPFADDHARTLTLRGQQAAGDIGDWLKAQGYVPDLIISSDATRAAQTATAVADAITPRPPIMWEPRLYHAAPDTIADLLRQQNAATIAVVGHNPGIGMLASMLVASAPKHHRFDDYPTCATTVINFDDATWVRARSGAATAFVVPRDLTA